MKVTIDELNKIITLLLSELKNSKGNQVELKNDYYWNIPSDQLYNPYEDPTGMTLGSLCDEWNEISRLLNEKNDPIPYDLKRIAEILKALSIENPDRGDMLLS